MTDLGEPRATRRNGWIAGVVLAVVTALAPAQAAPAQATTTQATTTQAGAGPTVEVLAVDELGYGAGIDVQLRMRGFRTPPSYGEPTSYRAALAAPGVEDLSKTPEAVVSRTRTVFGLSSPEVTRTFRIPAYPLDPTATYALYVVSDGAPVHEQAEAPITIDWAALVPHVALTAGEPTTVSYAGGELPVSVQDAPLLSVVTVTGLPGGRLERRVDLRGRISLPVRLADHVGTYTYTATLDVPDGAVGDGLTATGQITIVSVPTVVGTSFQQVPSPSRTGRLRTAVMRADGPVLVLPSPVAWKIYRGTRVVWYSGVHRQSRGTDVVVGLPKLARGTYRLVVGYGGTDDFQPATATRTFTVR